MGNFVIVIPVYNEEAIIGNTLLRLSDFLVENYPGGGYRIAVVDNASTDMTSEVVRSLTDNIPSISLITLEQKGKGLAIRSGWDYFAKDDFEVYAFMDADLATDLSALPALINGAAECDVCIGDRYHLESETIRTIKREVISRAYRAIARMILNSKISDFPCGFKAVNRHVLQNVVPKIKNHSWFFDSELLFWAERHGLKIKEIPVRWEDPRMMEQQSKVNIPKVAHQYLGELWRLRREKSLPLV